MISGKLAKNNLTTADTGAPYWAIYLAIRKSTFVPIKILEKAAIIYSEINEIMNKKAKHKHSFTEKDINGKTICFSCEKIKYTREKK